MKNSIPSGQRIFRALNNYTTKDYLIFLDTCALIEDAYADFRLLKYLCKLILGFQKMGQTDKHLAIPLKVIDELKKHSNNTKDPVLACASRKCLHVIKQLVQRKHAPLIKIYSNKTDNFADNVFIWAFNKFAVKTKMLLITRDRGLTLDIVNINKRQSYQLENPVVVLFLGKGPTYLQKFKIKT